MTTSNETFNNEYAVLETAAPAVSTNEAVKAVPMVQVVAPADLKEGYTFLAESSPGQSFTVVVVSLDQILSNTPTFCYVAVFYSMLDAYRSSR